MVDDALLWIDVPADGDSAPAAAAALQRLGLVAFDPAMLAYLRAGSLSPVRPEESSRRDLGVERRLREGARHRLVAAADMLCDPGQYGPAAPRIRARPVHMLAGPGWLLTTRPKGAVELSVDELAARVRWTGWATASAHDLATLMLRGLVATFLPAIDALTVQHMRAEATWLSPRTAGPPMRVQDADNLQRVIVAVRPGIFAVEQETVRLLRPGSSPADAWFLARQTPADAGEIATVLEQAREASRDLLDAQRGSLQLIASVIAAEQLTLAEAARQRAEGLQSLVAWLTALVLVPTLVASIFAALPQIGEHSSSHRAILVLAVTAAAAAIAGLIAYRKRSG